MMMNKLGPNYRLTTFVLALLLSVSCGKNMLPLNISEEGEGILIDVSTLGEYQTTVVRFRVSITASGEVVWEFAASSGTPQMWQVRLVPGENPTHPPPASHGEYVTAVPARQKYFNLATDIDYTVEVWGEKQGAARGSFRFNSDSLSEAP
jgi:hypothetical protein